MEISNLNKRDKALSLKMKMLTSTLPLALMAAAPSAYAQTAVNTASVTVPTGVVDSVAANDSATDSDTIIADLAAFDDTVTGVNGADGVTTAVSVLDNDTLNGSAVDPADVALTPVAILDPSGNPTTTITLNSDGTITVAPGTAAGDYTVEYQICEISNPTNCTTATMTITVDAAPIVSGTDTVTGVNGTDGGVGVVNVFDNDTLNGVAVDPADVTLTETVADPEGVLTLNPDGTVDVAPGSPAGTYELTYEICETLNPTNCTTATVEVTVDAAPITGVDDSFGPINSSDGGTTPSIYGNDTLNGQPIDPNEVTSTITDPDGLTGVVLNDDGTIDVPADTPAGTYEVVVETCEDLNPTNCTTSTTTIVVEASLLEVEDNDFTTTPIDSLEGGTTPSIYDNDTLNGAAINPNDVVSTITDSAGLVGLVLNPDGTIDVPADTPEGTYIVEVQTCEILNPTNCVVSYVTIVIAPSTAVLSGTVYLDADGDNEIDTDETVYAGWVVKVLDDKGNVVAEVVTDENGYYEVELPFGDFTVDFVNPDNGAVFITVEVEVGANTKLPNGELAVIINLPIDPSGVVYDSITRMPVQDVVMTMVDANGSPLPPLCFVDPSQQDQVTDSNGMYRFDIVPGADMACPVGQTDYRIIFDAPESHLDTNSTVIGAQPGYLTTNAGTGPIEVVPFVTAPQIGEDTTHYFAFTLGAGSLDVINNHIPIDPITLVRSPLDVTKSSPRRDVNFGDLIPYTITVTNTEDIPRVDLDIIDFTPPGFKYVEDTSRLNGAEVDPEISGRELVLNDYDFAANETKTWTMMMVVGASVSDGIYTNQAYVRDPLGTEVSDRAEAVVRVTPDPLFDCSELIGKVFDDKNKDGYQNEGEPGMAGVRLATAKGLLVTTDHNGRYHIACAAIPNGQIGSNFILKVDERTLPTGYHLTSENPRVVRLTRGKMSKANFGTALENIVTLDVTDAAFEAESDTLKPEFSGQLGQIVDALKGQKSTLRLTYYPSLVGRDERIDDLSAQIQELWEVYGGDYDLNIERKTVWPDGNNIQQTGAGE